MTAFRWWPVPEHTMSPSFPTKRLGAIRKSMLLAIGALSFQGSCAPLVLPIFRYPLDRLPPHGARAEQLLAQETEPRRSHWLAAVQLPRIEAADERHAMFCAQAISREMLIGARTMLAYYHVLMAFSFAGRVAFRFLLKIMPQTRMDAYVARWNMMIGPMSVFQRLDVLIKAAVFFGHELMLGRLSWKAVQKLTVDDRNILLNDWLARDSFGQICIGPIAEELAYRGCAQGLIYSALSSDLSMAMGAASIRSVFSRAVGAAYFGMAHASPVDSASAFSASVQKVIGTFASSLLIESRLAQRRRSVWAAAGAHMCFNFLVCTSCAAY